MAKTLEFYDLVAKESFLSDDYTITVNSKGMLVARATGPSGSTTVRIIGKA